MGSPAQKAQVQVAERCPVSLQPFHAAQLALARSGNLGKISQAQVSAAHGYHGISLIRKFLNAGQENATIRAFKFRSPLVDGPDRARSSFSRERNRIHSVCRLPPL